MTITTTPRSGWLNKLSTNNAFGSSRWQSRYFVLLDSELRYYKDEHSVTASRTLNLGDISKVTIINLANRKYCFKLEPTLYYRHHHATTKHSRKIWTIECQSETELESWVAAIDLRLCNLSLQDTLQPFSSPEPKRQQPFTSLSQIMSTSAGSEPHYYTNVPRPLKKSCPSISRRRGVILSPLNTCTIPGLLDSSDMLSSSSSHGSNINSPTSKPSTIEELEEDRLVCQQADKLVTQTAYILNASSPAFALYKTCSKM
ncbi:hypothetical protein EDC94DRAFT_631220 [Helicostylum pulchrum]|nr:hypothetical protein EDC94DRAFT_631220 [Helicostylum pulchrum]